MFVSVGQESHAPSRRSGGWSPSLDHSRESMGQTVGQIVLLDRTNPGVMWFSAFSPSPLGGGDSTRAPSRWFLGASFPHAGSGGRNPVVRTDLQPHVALYAQHSSEASSYRGENGLKRRFRFVGANYWPVSIPACRVTHSCGWRRPETPHTILDAGSAMRIVCACHAYLACTR